MRVREVFSSIKVAGIVGECKPASLTSLKYELLKTAGSCEILTCDDTYQNSTSDLILKGAFKADTRCYGTYNIRGDENGYCKRYSSSSFKACTPR